MIDNTSSHPFDSPVARFKIGLIVDSEIVSKYVYELAEWCQLQNDLSVEYLIVQQGAIADYGGIYRAASILGRFKKVIRRILWALICKMEMQKLKNTFYKDHLQQKHLSKVISKSLIIQVQISDGCRRFCKEDVDRVRSLNLDLLIQCSSGILGGDILKASRLGIISLNQAGNSVNGCAPPAFWEVYSKQEKTEFLIQQLTEDFNGAKILTRGAFTTQNYYLLNQAQLYTRSNFYMRQFLSQIAQLGTLTGQDEPLPYCNRLVIPLRSNTLIEYILRLTYRTMREVVTRRLLKKTQRWGVAFCRTNWRNLVMCRGIKIEPPPNHFLADPFVIAEGHRDYCFVEDYDYHESKGCISVYELKEKNAIRLGEAITEPFHMSFPYLFRFDAKIYMVPETSATKEIRLYECVNFPLQWRLCKILMSGVSAVDTMIFEYDNLWWLFTNIDLSGFGGEHGSELSIFYSETPLTDNWKPHSKNPIFIDPSKARNAGILFDKGEVYRVNQIPEFRRYAKGFSINKISTLTCRSYKEDTICSVEPSFFENQKATHHLHSDGNTSVFDYREIIRVA